MTNIAYLCLVAGGEGGAAGEGWWGEVRRVNVREEKSYCLFI